MNIKEMRYATGMTQKEFAERFHIPIGRFGDGNMEKVHRLLILWN